MKQRVEQRLLVFEMVIDRPDRASRSLCDIRHGQAVHTLFHDQLFCRIQQCGLGLLSACLLRLAPALAGMVRMFLPDFVARDSGRVLNVTSTAAEASGPLQASYFASKAFAANLSNALVEELADTRITVTNFMPTATESEFAQRAGMKNSKLFQNTTSARQVAQDGYDAMLRGDMDAYGGMGTKRWIMQQMLKYMPKRAALRAVRNAQEVA